jgi:NPCBM-associated, NEW3 domain of alpha-galactosidase
LRRLLHRILLAAVLLIAAGPALAQTGTPFNERDDQYRLLGLKRAKQSFEIAREAYERNRVLFEQGVISANELDASRQILSEAEVNFQQSLLAVLFEQQYVAVMEAVKFQSESGRANVRLKLANTSGGSAEFQHLVPSEDELFQSLRPEIVHDVYVSLSNEDGAIISQPYEAKIEELRYGAPAELTFKLLQDVDSVTVNLAYGQSSQRTVRIFLQKDTTVDRVAVQSEQFAQEVELGSSATFDLTLELFSGISDTFKLQVVNLPTQINRYFLDPASQARLSQFKFTESSRTRDAALRISLPDRPSDEVTMDRAIPFYVLAIPRQRLDSISLGASATQEEIEALGVGFVRLELVPRGVGELLVRVPQLFYSIEPDGAAEVTLELVNDGTRRLDNVEVIAEPPHRWDKVIEPSTIASIEVGKESKVTLRLDPPDDITPGKYEVRIRSSSFSDDQPIEGEDKTISVEVRPEVRVLAPALIAVGLLGLVSGVVYTGVRLSRR